MHGDQRGPDEQASVLLPDWHAMVEQRPPHQRGRGMARAVPALICIAVYCILGAFVYGVHSPLTSSTLPTCGCGDISSVVWLKAWPAYALAHGHNPFYTTWANYPHGVNLMSNTSAVLLGVVFAPVTWLLGPLSTFSLVVRLAFAISATAMYLALRRWTRWWPAAGLGGLLYGFSPFMVGQGQSHDFLIWTPLVPVAMVLLDEIAVRHRHLRRNGVLLGLTLVAQLLISAEVLAIMAVMAAFGLTAVAVAHPVGTYQRARGLVVGFVATAVTFVVVGGYPLWLYLRGPAHVSGPPHATSDLAQYHASVLSLVYPTDLERIGFGSWAARGISLMQGNDAEHTVYIGVPLLCILAFVLVRCWHVGAVRLFSLLALAAWTVTLGPQLYVGLTEHPAIELPYDALASIPLVDGVEDLRFSLVMYLSIAVVLAIGLDRIYRDGLVPLGGGQRHARRPRLRRGVTCLVVAAVGLAPLVPALPYPSTPVKVPAVFSAADSPVAGGDIVLSYPLPIRVPYAGPNDQVLLWQAAVGLRFKLIGFRGAVAVPKQTPDQPALLSPPQAEQVMLWAFYGQPAPPPRDAATARAIRTFLARYHVDAVTMVPSGGRHEQAVMTYLTAALHTKPVDFQGSYVWSRVQDILSRLRAG